MSVFYHHCLYIRRWLVFLFIFVEFDGFGLFWRVVTLHLAGSDSTQAVVLDETLTELSSSVSVHNSVGDTFNHSGCAKGLLSDLLSVEDTKLRRSIETGLISI